jgi:alpha-1,2-mannosyltransferase
VWAVILLVAVTMRSSLPGWAVWLSRAWAIWIALCLPLAVLPYGSHKELDYTAGQKFVGNLGPTLGTVLVLALGVHALVTMRKEVIQRSALLALPSE